MDTQIQTKLANFFSRHRLVTYKKGELIYRAGDTIDTVDFVKSGYIRLYTLNKSAEETTINLFKPLFYITLIEALTKDVSTNKYYMEAVTDVEVWKAPKSEFIEFIKPTNVSTSTDINYEILKAIAGLASDLINNLESVIPGSASQKIGSILITLAEKYGSTKDGELSINFETTHRLIASMAGLTRETTSTQIKKLENNGLIAQRSGFIIIKDLEKLREV